MQLMMLLYSSVIILVGVIFIVMLLRKLSVQQKPQEPEATAAPIPDGPMLPQSAHADGPSADKSTSGYVPPTK